MVLGAVFGLAIVAALIAYGLWFLATDTCLDRGGKVLGTMCESGTGQVALTSLVSPIIWSIASVVFLVTLAGTWSLVRGGPPGVSRRGI
jgi:hypothetical protein